MARNYITRASPKEIGSFFKRLLYPSTLLQFSPCYQEVPFFKKKKCQQLFLQERELPNSLYRGKETNEGERVREWNWTIVIISKTPLLTCAVQLVSLGRSQIYTHQLSGP